MLLKSIAHQWRTQTDSDKNNAVRKNLQTAYLSNIQWSCLTDSNRRPLPYQGSALPAELKQHYSINIITYKNNFVNKKQHINIKVLEIIAIYQNFNKHPRLPGDVYSTLIN